MQNYKTRAAAFRNVAAHPIKSNVPYFKGFCKDKTNIRTSQIILVFLTKNIMHLVGKLVPLYYGNEVLNSYKPLTK